MVSESEWRPIGEGTGQRGAGGDCSRRPNVRRYGVRATGTQSELAHSRPVKRLNTIYNSETCLRSVRSCFFQRWL